MPSLDQIRAKLASKEEEVQESAFADIDALLPARWREVLALSTGDFQNAGTYTWESVSARILQRLRSFRRPELIGELENIYDLLQKRAGAQGQVIRLLAEMESKEAMEAIVRLAKRPSSQGVGFRYELNVQLEKEAPDYGRWLFPGLLEALPGLSSSSRVDVLDLAACYAAADLFHPAQHPAAIQNVHDWVEEIMKDLGSKQPKEDGITACINLEHIALFLQHSNDDHTRRLLRTLVDNHSLYAGIARGDFPGTVRVMALSALLWHGETVDPAVLEDLAAHHATRWRLYERLHEICKPSLFPEKYRNQKDLAEAEMVMWIESPMELGSPPEKIELLAIRPVPGERGQKYVNYFFKFQHPDSGDCWKVGMAGPYREQGPPSIGGHRTFSLFRELESKSLEDHFRDYEE